MARQLTFHQAAYALQGFQKELRGAVRRPFSRQLTKLRRRIQDRLKVKGVTGGITRSRAAAGRAKVKRSDLQINVRVSRPRVRGGPLATGGIVAVGVVAIQETGGQLAPHKIEPRRPGGVLKFAGKGGDAHFSRTVMHPGAKVPRNPTVVPETKRWEPELNRAVQESVVETAQKVIG